MNSDRKKRQSILIYGIIAVAAAVIIYLIVGDIKSAVNTVTTGPVHWHADFTYEVCGEELKLKDTESHGSIIHSHNDGRIHIEGIVLKNEDITLEKFIKSTGEDISNDHFREHKNGEICANSGKAGKVTFYLNDAPYFDASQIVIADKQKIRIVFE